MVNLRPKYFKLLKTHGKYDRRHFSMKLVDIIKECDELGLKLDTTEPVQQSVQQLKININEPEFSDDEIVEQAIEQPVKKVKKPKKVKIQSIQPVQQPVQQSVQQPVQQPIQQSVKINRITDKKTDNKKEIQKLIKNLSNDTFALLTEFDEVDDLTDDDTDYIDKEFDVILQKTYDDIDNLLESSQYDKNYIDFLEKKIQIIIEKKNKFLSL
jgi:hypothetical protein